MVLKFTKKFNLVLTLYKLYIFNPLMFFQFNFNIKVQFLFYFLVSDLRNEREKSLDLDGEKSKRVLSTP